MTTEDTLDTLRLAVVERTIQRLESTYLDFFQTIPGYDQFPAFFRLHLYSPPNKAKRDASLEALYLRLRAVAGPDMTENIRKLLTLLHLSDSLDQQTAEHLIAASLNTPESIAALDPEEYDRLIARIGRLDDRALQIQLICDTLSFFFMLARLPFSRFVLAPVRVAAGILGAEQLIETMDRGYEIATRIKDLKPFTAAFALREGAYLERLKSLRGLPENRGLEGARI